MEIHTDLGGLVGLPKPYGFGCYKSYIFLMYEFLIHLMPGAQA